MLNDNDLWAIFWVLLFSYWIVKAVFFGLSVYKHGWMPSESEQDKNEQPVINNYFFGEKNGD